MTTSLVFTPPTGSVASLLSTYTLDLSSSVSGGSTPYTYSVTAGSLPSGLSLGRSTGVISGTPTAVGTYTATVKVTDSVGTTASGSLSITVGKATQGPIILPNTSGAQVGVALRLAPYGGSGTGALSVSSSTGTITSAGTDLWDWTVGGSGFWTVDITRAGDATYNSITSTFYVYFSLPTLIVTPKATPAGATVGQTAPTLGYTLSPSGVTLSTQPTYNIKQNGVTVQGIDTSSAGTYVITPLGAAASGYTVSYTTATFTVSPALAFIAPTTGLDAHVAAIYTLDLSSSVSGGLTPYTYSVTSGSLPSGLSLGSSTGVISGTPTAVGTYTVTVTVTDANGATASNSFSINVSSTTPSVPNGLYVTQKTDSAVDLTWWPPTYAGASDITSYTVTVTPSTGVTVTQNDASQPGASVSGLTTGTTYTFSVTATNSYGTSAAAIATYSVPSGSGSTGSGAASVTVLATGTSPCPYKQLQVSVTSSVPSGSILTVNVYRRYNNTVELVRGGVQLDVTTATTSVVYDYEVPTGSANVDYAVELFIDGESAGISTWAATYAVSDGGYLWITDPLDPQSSLKIALGGYGNATLGNNSFEAITQEYKMNKSQVLGRSRPVVQYYGRKGIVGLQFEVLTRISNDNSTDYGDVLYKLTGVGLVLIRFPEAMKGIARKVYGLLQGQQLPLTWRFNSDNLTTWQLTFDEAEPQSVDVVASPFSYAAFSQKLGNGTYSSASALWGSSTAGQVNAGWPYL